MVAELKQLNLLNLDTPVETWMIPAILDDIGVDDEYKKPVRDYSEKFVNEAKRLGEKEPTIKDLYPFAIAYEDGLVAAKKLFT
jgi:hypothetical protein